MLIHGLLGILSTTSEGGAISSASFPTAPAPTYKAFWKQLANAVDGTAAPPVDPNSAAQVIKVIEMTEKSALERRSILMV